MQKKILLGTFHPRGRRAKVSLVWTTQTSKECNRNQGNRTCSRDAEPGPSLRGGKDGSGSLLSALTTGKRHSKRGVLPETCQLQQSVMKSRLWTHHSLEIPKRWRILRVSMAHKKDVRLCACEYSWPAEAGCLQSWSYRKPWTTLHGFWGTNPDFLQQQQALFEKHQNTLCECFFFVCMCVCVPYVSGAHGGQKRVSDLLELWMTDSREPTMWVLRAEPRSSARATLLVPNSW